MTRSEFDQWLAYHTSYYPGLATWFEKMTPENRRGVVDRWASVLAGVSLQSAKRASEELYDQERQPQAYERHAANVKRLALDLNAQSFASSHRMHDGQPTYACPLCKDGGWVTVYATGSHYQRLVEIIGPERAAKRTQAVACTCDAGRRIAEFAIRYQPEDMELVRDGRYSPPADQEDWAKVRKLFGSVG